MMNASSLSVTASDLEQRLWVAAREIATQAGYEYTVPCAHNVKDFLRAGVRNMTRLGRTHEADLEEAEANLSLWVQAMIKASAATTGSKSIKILREGSLVMAKRLCPLWPFC